MDNSTTPFLEQEAANNTAQAGGARWKKPALIIAAIGVVGVVAFAGVSLGTSNSSSSDQHTSTTGSGKRAVFGESDPFPSIYKTSGCPWHDWVNSLPSDFSLWEQLVRGKFFDAWKAACHTPSEAETDAAKAGCPTGFKENDHNYNTVLGQGNTLAFLAGHLDISSSLPANLRFGLLAETKSIPAVVRVSDFGSDDSAIRLARMAIKLPYASSTQYACNKADGSTLQGGSWYEEFNLLFTESLDTFPLANYEEIANFAGDPDATTWSKFTSGWSFIKVLTRNAGRFYADRKKGLLAKQYFTQLPYQMTCGKAAKFHLEPVQSACGWFSSECCVPSNGQDKLHQALDTSAYITKCGATFSLKMQLKDIARDWKVINEDAAAGWDEEEIEVARLVIPAQEIVDTYYASGKALILSLIDTLSVPKVQQSGVHKLFAFHPILMPNEHRPLGQVNTFRSHFYAEHAGARYDSLLQGFSENAPYKVPFGAFKGDSAAKVNELMKSA